LFDGPPRLSAIKDAIAGEEIFATMPFDPAPTTAPPVHDPVICPAEKFTKLFKTSVTMADAIPCSFDETEGLFISVFIF
jgi:hypothetical protein